MTDEKTEGRRRAIINIIYYAVAAAAVYFAFRFAVGFLLPFFAAYLIAAPLRPLAATVSKVTHMKYKWASLLIVVLFYCTVGAIVFIICAELVELAGEFIPKIPEIYSSKIEPQLRSLLASVMGVPDDPDKSLASMLAGLSDVISSVGTILTSLSSWAVERVSAFAMSMPAFLVKTVFAVVASFYFVADHETLGGFVMRQFSEGTRERVRAARSAVREILLSYLRSYAVIMGITFLELTASFLILQVRGAVLLAALIAVFDILPVVGTGTILLPWIAVEVFVNANYGFAVGLAVAYVVIFIVRNIMEPKIVGHGVGLHPLVTLIAMFVGTALFGFVGLFGLPIATALLVELNDKGVIKLFEK